MKTHRSHLLRLLATVITIILSCAFGGRAATDETSGNLPHAVRFELGDAQFARGAREAEAMIRRARQRRPDIVDAQELLEEIWRGEKVA